MELSKRIPKFHNFFLFFYQSYFVSISLEDLDESDGFERSSFPEGIPSLPEYLADYCSAAVRHTFLYLC